MAKNYEKIDDTTYKETVDSLKTLVPLISKKRFLEGNLLRAQQQFDDITAEIAAIKALGVKEWKILFKHILP